MKYGPVNTEGKIRTGATEYTVTCAGQCGMSHIAHLYSQRQFIAELHSHSWEKIGKKWWCWICYPAASRRKK